MVNIRGSAQFWGIVGVVLCLSIWEINADTGLYRLFTPGLPSAFFPKLTQIGSAILLSLISSPYWHDVWLTVMRVLSAFLLSALSGVIAALMLSRYGLLQALTHYPIEFLRQLPAIAVIPFAILLFGIYTPMKIAVAFFGCFFPVYVATMNAFRNTDVLLLQTAEAYRWRGLRFLFGVMLPSATSAVIGILHVALSIALILVVMSEMLVGSDGLGGRLAELELSFRLTELYAETFLLGVWGVVLSMLLRIAGGAVYYWREDSSAETPRLIKTTDL